MPAFSPGLLAGNPRRVRGGVPRVMTGPSPIGVLGKRGPRPDVAPGVPDPGGSGVSVTLVPSLPSRAAPCRRRRLRAARRPRRARRDQPGLRGQRAVRAGRRRRGGRAAALVRQRAPRRGSAVAALHPRVRAGPADGRRLLRRPRRRPRDLHPQHHRRAQPAGAGRARPAPRWSRSHGEHHANLLPWPRGVGAAAGAQRPRRGGTRSRRRPHRAAPGQQPGAAGAGRGDRCEQRDR